MLETSLEKHEGKELSNQLVELHFFRTFFAFKGEKN